MFGLRKRKHPDESSYGQFQAKNMINRNTGLLKSSIGASTLHPDTPIITSHRDDFRKSWRQIHRESRIF